MGEGNIVVTLVDVSLEVSRKYFNMCHSRIDYGL